MSNSNFEHIDEKMIKLEVNLDDTSSEWLGFLMDKLLEAKVADVFYSPIYMKKNRPAVMLQVLCSLEQLDTIKEIIFNESTTLGIRYYPMTVHRLERHFYELDTPWGKVTIKEGKLNGVTVQQAPEYEDCRRIAEEQQLPLKKVFQYIWKQLK